MRGVKLSPKGLQARIGGTERRTLTGRDQAAGAEPTAACLASKSTSAVCNSFKAVRSSCKSSGATVSPRSWHSKMRPAALMSSAALRLTVERKRMAPAAMAFPVGDIEHDHGGSCGVVDVVGMAVGCVKRCEAMLYIAATCGVNWLALKRRYEKGHKRERALD